MSRLGGLYCEFLGSQRTRAGAGGWAGGYGGCDVGGDPVVSFHGKGLGGRAIMESRLDILWEFSWNVYIRLLYIGSTII